MQNFDNRSRRDVDQQSSFCCIAPVSYEVDHFSAFPVTGRAAKCILTSPSSSCRDKHAQVPIAKREKLLIKGGVDPKKLKHLRLVYNDPQVHAPRCCPTACERSAEMHPFDT